MDDILTVDFIDDNFEVSLSDEDEPIPGYIRRFRDRANPFDMFNDTEFRNRFRFSKETTSDLIFIVMDDIQSSTLRSHALTAAQKVSLFH